jgi:hypothetical protein
LLESKNKTLQAQLDNRAKRKEVEEKLGRYHIQIMNRAHAIQSMRYAEYEKKYGETFWKDEPDPDTAALLDEIHSHHTGF